MEHCLKAFEEPQNQEMMKSSYNQWATTPKRKTAKGFATYQKKFKRNFLAGCTGTKTIILVPTNKPAKNIKRCMTQVKNEHSKKMTKFGYKAHVIEATRNKTKKMKYSEFEKEVSLNNMKLCTGQLKAKLVNVKK